MCDSLDANDNRPQNQTDCENVGVWYPATCSIIRQDERDDNVYHVLTADKSVTSGTLDGFTITRGNAQTRRCYDTNSPFNCTDNLCVRDFDCASGEKCGKCCKDGSNDNKFCVDGEDCPDPGVCFGFPSNDGAGLFNRGGTLTINNCNFTVNYADFRGGGLMNLSATDPFVAGNLTLTNTDFVSNHVVDNGGGVYNGPDTVMDPTTCNFVGNTSNTSGGGVCNRQTVGTWDNCKFIGNRAEGPEVGNGGGGLFNASSSPTFTDCEFFENDVLDQGGGGGMWNETDEEDSPPGPPSSPLLTNCHFIENVTRGSSQNSGGGGMWNEGGSSPTLMNCTFLGNTVDGHYGGAMWNEDSGTNPMIRSCVFVRNGVSLGGSSGAAAGGAMFVHEFAAPVIIDSVFISNSASEGALGGGGGINTHLFGSAEIINCVFASNSTKHEGGALDADQGVDVKVSNSIFVGNSAKFGGALSEDVGGLTITNCIVVENEASSPGALGGGIHEVDFIPLPPSAIIVNSIFWDNKDSTGTVETAQISNILADKVTYTDWQGHSGDPGQNIINDDPMFLILELDQWSSYFSAQYNDDTYQTIFTDSDKRWTVDEFQDMILNPDTGQMQQTLVISNTADTITVWGKFASTASVGETFRITGYRTRSCALIDAGNSDALPPGTASNLDLAGNTRKVDDPSVPPDGSDFVDLGAYEFSGTTDGVTKDSIDKNRFMSFTAGNAGWQTAIRVKLVTMYAEKKGCSHNNAISCNSDVDCRPGGSCGQTCGDSNATCDVINTNGCPNRLPPLSDLAAFDGEDRWLGTPAVFDDNNDAMPDFVAAALTCGPYYRDWSPGALTAEFLSARSCSNNVAQSCIDDSECGAGNTCSVQVLHVFGAEIVPCSKYDVQVIRECCPGPPFDPLCFSSPAVQIDTALWGDVWATFGNVNFTDIGKVVDAFRGIVYVPGSPEGGAPPKVRAMLGGNVLPVSETLNFTDIGMAVEGFKGLPYPEDGPNACPSAEPSGQICGLCADGGASCDSDAECGGVPCSCEPQDSLCTAPASCGRDAYGNDPIWCRDKSKRYSDE